MKITDVTKTADAYRKTFLITEEEEAELAKEAEKDESADSEKEFKRTARVEIDKIVSKLDTLADALEDAKNVSNDIVDYVAALPDDICSLGELRLIGLQLDRYLVGTLENFIDSDYQASSVSSLKKLAEEAEEELNNPDEA